MSSAPQGPSTTHCATSREARRLGWQRAHTQRQCVGYVEHGRLSLLLARVLCLCVHVSIISAFFWEGGEAPALAESAYAMAMRGVCGMSFEWLVFCCRLRVWHMHCVTIREGTALRSWNAHTQRQCVGCVERGQLCPLLARVLSLCDYQCAATSCADSMPLFECLRVVC